MEGRNWTEGLGARIRSIRRESRLDQEQFGESIGVGRQSVSAYETGRLMPARRVIERVAEVYGVAPWWVIFGIKGERDDEYIPAVSIPGNPGGRKLSPAQRLLVNYILDEKTDAKKVAQKLLSKGLDR